MCKLDATKASWISTYYGAIKEISEDNYKEETNEIYNCYINKILEMTGISNNYKKIQLIMLISFMQEN